MRELATQPSLAANITFWLLPLVTEGWLDMMESCCPFFKWAPLPEPKAAQSGTYLKGEGTRNASVLPQPLPSPSPSLAGFSVSPTGIFSSEPPSVSPWLPKREWYVSGHTTLWFEVWWRGGGGVQRISSRPGQSQSTIETTPTFSKAAYFTSFIPHPTTGCAPRPGQARSVQSSMQSIPWADK